MNNDNGSAKWHCKGDGEDQEEVDFDLNGFEQTEEKEPFAQKEDNHDSSYSFYEQFDEEQQKTTAIDIKSNRPNESPFLSQSIPLDLHQQVVNSVSNQLQDEEKPQALEHNYIDKSFSESQLNVTSNNNNRISRTGSICRKSKKKKIFIFLPTSPWVLYLFPGNECCFA